MKVLEKDDDYNDDALNSKERMEAKNNADAKKVTSNRQPLNLLSNNNLKTPNGAPNGEGDNSGQKDCRHEHNRYTAFKYKTCLKIWPLQELALNHVDKLVAAKKYSSFKVLKRSTNSSGREPECPLWSMEPRIFAMEEPTSGKRRYLSRTNNWTIMHKFVIVG